MTGESAKAAAEDFLAQVLEDGESAPCWDDTPGGRQLPWGPPAYRFYGEILVNGLSAGLSFSISVRCEDNAVLSFSRDSLEGMVIGDIPAPQAGVTAAQAAQALRSTLQLRLEYVLPEGRRHHRRAALSAGVRRRVLRGRRRGRW